MNGSVANSSPSRIFVNRQSEKLNFENALNNLVDGNLGKQFLNYWGVGGIGKTELIKNEFFRILNQQPTERNWHYVYVDFEAKTPLDIQNGESPSIVSFGSCLDAIRLSLQKSTPPIPLDNQQLEAAIQNNERQVEATKLSNDQLIATWLVAQLEDFLHNNRLLLVFDGLSQVKNWFVKLEEFFLSPLVNKKLLLVIGSRSQIRLERFELRRQLESYPLLALKAPSPEAKLLDEVIKQQFQLLEQADPVLLPKIAEQLQILTVGHPATIVHLLDWLGSDVQVAWSKLETKQKEVRIELMNFILERYAQPAENHLERSHRKIQLNLAMREMAIYRRFDANILQHATVQAVREEDRPWFSGESNNPGFYLGLSQEMMLTRMVEWETRRRGFVIDDTYRYILAAGLEAEDANLFTRRHEVAIQQYLILLAAQRGDQETRATYLIELLYHILKTDGTNLLESVNRLNSYTQKGQIPTKHLLVSEESRLSFAAIQEVIPLPSQDVIQKVFGAKYNHDINVEIITLLNKLEPAATPFSWLNL